jgi:type II secretory pathway component GspD/PulD (secretin)
MNMHNFPRKTAICALTALLSLATLSAAAPPVKQEEGATITPNYKDADLSQIIQAVSEVTGKNFIIDPRVNAKVTMLSATPMSPRYRPAKSSRSCRIPMRGNCRRSICPTT